MAGGQAPESGHPAKPHVMDGLLVIDKPVGPTSHDVVARVRRILGERRVGHTGTLDPGASGVLPLVVGRATRLARFLSAAGKSYDAAIQLGVATDTGDSAGSAGGTRVPRTVPRARVDRSRARRVSRDVPAAATGLLGEKDWRQAQPSAGARRLRTPWPPRLPSRPLCSVTVHALELGSVEGGRVTLHVDCSAGFYVRGLAHDLGRRLGIGGHLAALKRVRSGDLTLADAAVLAALELDPPAALAALVPLAQMLPALTALTLTQRRRPAGAATGSTSARRISKADSSPALPPPARGRSVCSTTAGDLVGVAEPIEGSGLLHPAVVLV